MPLMNFQNAIRRVDGVDSFQVIVTKEDETDIAGRDRVIVYICIKEGVDVEVVKAEITKQVKINTEISPDEINIEEPEKIEQRLFERTGLKADWVVDQRELHV